MNEPPSIIRQQLREAADRMGDVVKSLLKTLAWIDGDGYHVNVVHYCTGARREVFTLPHPQWRALDGQVVPSVACDECGFHEHLTISGKAEPK